MRRGRVAAFTVAVTTITTVAAVAAVTTVATASAQQLPRGADSLVILVPDRVFIGTADTAVAGWAVLVRGDRIAAVGPRAKFKPASAAALRGDTPEGDLDGRSIQPALTGLMAREAGVELTVRESEDRVDFTVHSAALRTISAAACR